MVVGLIGPVGRATHWTPPITLHYPSARPVRLRCRDVARARRGHAKSWQIRVSKRGSENNLCVLTRGCLSSVSSQSGNGHQTDQKDSAWLATDIRFRTVIVTLAP